MEKQTLAQTQETRQDRKLTISVAPKLRWTSLDPLEVEAYDPEFTELSSQPNMPNAVDKKTGDIDISNMKPNGKYTDNIDITLVLDTRLMLDIDGNPIPDPELVRWAAPDQGPTYTNSEGQTEHLGFCWFCEITDLPTRQYRVSPPITVPGMSISLPTQTEILIDDNTPGGSPVYAFCMAFVLPQFQDKWLKIDPMISRKGEGDPPVMFGK